MMVLVEEPDYNYMLFDHFMTSLYALHALPLAFHLLPLLLVFTFYHLPPPLGTLLILSKVKLHEEDAGALSRATIYRRSWKGLITHRILKDSKKYVLRYSFKSKE